MTDPGRVVVVAAGFALWLGGKCMAAARWSDVQRLRVIELAAGGERQLAINVELVDGSIVQMHELAPGFDLFVDRATSTLSGLLPATQWRAALAGSTHAESGMVIYEKRTLGERNVHRTPRVDRA